MAKEQQQSRELVPQPVVDIKAGSGLEGSRALFLPASYVEAKAMAADMASSTAVPGHLRNKEGNCLAVLMQAARWGLDPFAVSSKTYFINDQIAFEAQLVNAVVISSKILEGRLSISFTGEGNALRCLVKGKIKGDPEVKTKTQAISRITVRNSPLWKTDPEQQLGYYTTRAWARLHAPDVLMGVYTPDELNDGAEAKRIQQQGQPVAGRPQRSDFVDPVDQTAGVDEDAGVDQTVDAEFEHVDDVNESEAATDQTLGGDQDSQTAETASPDPAEAQKTGPEGEDSQSAKPAEKPMPKNPAEWEGWKRNVLLEIGKRKTVEDLDRLQAAQKDRTEAAPTAVRKTVENSFTDKRIDLMEGDQSDG